MPGAEFLIVSPRQIADMFWTPPCGSTVDVEWARKRGDMATLEKIIGSK